MSRLDEAREAASRKPVYMRAVAALQSAFRQIEARAPKPVREDLDDRSRFRYPNHEIEAAIFLKFAALCSAIQALEALVEDGRVLEQAAIQRLIEDLNEDIVFLALAVTQGEVSELHKEYLGAFWMEDYSDHHRPVETKTKRPMVGRRKISAHIHRATGQADPSSSDHAKRSISDMYNGFLHGAAPHLMELFDENEKIFRLDGILGSTRHIDYILDAQNSFYRALLSGIWVAKALGVSEVLDYLVIEKAAFVSVIGLPNLEAVKS